MMPLAPASPLSRQFLNFLSINSHGQHCTGWQGDRRLSAPRLKGGQVARPLASRRAQVVRSLDDRPKKTKSWPSLFQRGGPQAENRQQRINAGPRAHVGRIGSRG
jgi:hypothetical protein